MTGLADAVNAFELTATLIARDVLRYTPSGMPVVECALHHVSELLEAGQSRRVELEAKAVAFDAVARRLEASPLDTVFRFRGFVANQSRKSKRTVFHIVDFRSVDSQDAKPDPLKGM